MRQHRGQAGDVDRAAELKVVATVNGNEAAGRRSPAHRSRIEPAAHGHLADVASQLQVFDRQARGLRDDSPRQLDAGQSDAIAGECGAVASSRSIVSVPDVVRSLGNGAAGRASRWRCLGRRACRSVRCRGKAAQPRFGDRERDALGLQSQLLPAADRRFERQARIARPACGAAPFGPATTICAGQ